MMRWITTEVQEILAMKECIASINRTDNRLADLRDDLAGVRKLYQAHQKNETTFKGVWLKLTGKTKTEE